MTTKKRVIKVHNVKSSNIKEIGFDPKTQKLQINFLNGSKYQYEKVTAHQFADIMAAKSHGAALSKDIKGKHKFTQITPSESD